MVSFGAHIRTGSVADFPVEIKKILFNNDLSQINLNQVKLLFILFDEAMSGDESNYKKAQ